MEPQEFDRFADEYRDAHARNITVSGESPEFFHAYKVADVARSLGPREAARPLSILDFGCGVGNSLRYFRIHFPQAAITGADVSLRSLDIAAQRFPELRHDLRRLDSEGPLPFEPRTFDMVFAACVFHHIAPARHQALFEEWRRILRPGGHAFVFEHNPYNPLTVHAVKTCPFDEHATLIRPDRLVCTVERAGLSSARCGFRIFFPHALRQFRFAEPWLGWLPLGAQYRVWARRP